MTRICGRIKYFVATPNLLRACLVLCLIGFGETVFGQGDKGSTPILACSPDVPTVKSGDKIGLKAWSDLPGKEVQFLWTATDGKILGAGTAPSWDFKNVGPGLYHAAVKVKASSGTSAECSLQVFVREGQRSGPHARETGRSFLAKGKEEDRGYALYSYLLLGASPTDSSRERYVAAIQSYLNTIIRVEELEAYQDRNHLNVTLLPINIAAGPSVSAHWLLEHYDYARARFLLDKLPGDHRDGPYIVSTLEPLSKLGTLSDHYLFQDLSKVPAAPSDLMSWWLREFMGQAAQETFWEERTGEQFALRLRTTISVLAVGIPAVRDGLSSAIEWIH